MELKLTKGCDVALIDGIDFAKLEPGDKLFCQKIFHLLNDNDIEFSVLEHPEVITSEEGNFIHEYFGHSCDPVSLFLTNKKRTKHFVVSKMQATKFQLKDLKSIVMAQFPNEDFEIGKRFEFGKEEDMHSILKVICGCVSPFAVMNDESKETVLFLDEKMLENEEIQLPPLMNTMTVNLKMKDFIDLLAKSGVKYHVVNFEPDTGTGA